MSKLDEEVPVSDALIKIMNDAFEFGGYPAALAKLSSPAAREQLHGAMIEAEEDSLAISDALVKGGFVRLAQLTDFRIDLVPSTPAPAKQPRAPRRPRKPSIDKLIAAAEQSGRTVTSVTTPDGHTIRFDEPTEATNPFDSAFHEPH
jgi:hypothetical protein